MASTLTYPPALQVAIAELGVKLPKHETFQAKDDVLELKRNIDAATFGAAPYIDLLGEGGSGVTVAAPKKTPAMLVQEKKNADAKKVADAKRIEDQRLANNAKVKAQQATDAKWLRDYETRLKNDPGPEGQRWRALQKKMESAGVDWGLIPLGAAVISTGVAVIASGGAVAGALGAGAAASTAAAAATASKVLGAVSTGTKVVGAVKTGNVAALASVAAKNLPVSTLAPMAALAPKFVTPAVVKATVAAAKPVATTVKQVTAAAKPVVQAVQQIKAAVKPVVATATQAVSQIKAIAKPVTSATTISFAISSANIDIKQAMAGADKLLGDPNVKNATIIVKNTKAMAALGDPAALRGLAVLTAVAHVRTATATPPGKKAIPETLTTAPADLTVTHSPTEVRQLAKKKADEKHIGLWARIITWLKA